MQKVYYTEEQQVNIAVRSAVGKALNIIAENSEIKTITLLFSTILVAEDLLSGVIPKNSIKNRRLHCDNPSCWIHIETIKTYSTYSPHILIPVFIGEKELATIEDEWNARIWVVIPNSLELMENWLKVHAAQNVKTGQSLVSDYSLDDRVVNGIEWLWATSFPNEGFNHPLDLNRLKCMSNALAMNNVPLDYYSVLYYCINHKINHEGGRMIADHFVKAQTKRFKTDGNYPLVFMTEMMNTKHERI